MMLYKCLGDFRQFQDAAGSHRKLYKFLEDLGESSIFHEILGSPRSLRRAKCVQNYLEIRKITQTFQQSSGMPGILQDFIEISKGLWQYIAGSEVIQKAPE